MRRRFSSALRDVTGCMLVAMAFLPPQSLAQTVDLFLSSLTAPGYGVPRAVPAGTKDVALMAEFQLNTGEVAQATKERFKQAFGIRVRFVDVQSSTSRTVVGGLRGVTIDPMTSRRTCTVDGFVGGTKATGPFNVPTTLTTGSIPVNQDGISVRDANSDRLVEECLVGLAEQLYRAMFN